MQEKQMTFVEQDVETIKNFIDFVAVEAKFTLDTKKCFAYSKHYKGAIEVMRKMEANILELRQVIDPEKDKKEKK